jgi:hypothetical protein
MAGPDPVAWNSLVAAFVNFDRLADAAAAVERAVQATAAAGISHPPVEAFAALIRGYRRAGSKGRAVATLRRFLSLGGQPCRVMCNDVITLCLRDSDVKTARQVVRAMQLTGCVSEDDADSYTSWFERWEVRQQAAQFSRQNVYSSSSSMSGSMAAAAAGASSSSGSPRPATAAGAAVERLKWWLGLPNNYYREPPDNNRWTTASSTAPVTSDSGRSEQPGAAAAEAAAAATETIRRRPQQQRLKEPTPKPAVEDNINEQQQQL